ncbi:uncharacterized protein [Euphorbia lathyris]|uniref:uncharacterized protein n=1 Tax=Euphorbia lathyris TaxID=212925 RepID=UPI003313BB73
MKHSSMGGGNVQKDKTTREKNMEKNQAPKESQLEANMKAMHIQEGYASDSDPERETTPGIEEEIEGEQNIANRRTVMQRLEGIESSNNTLINIATRSQLMVQSIVLQRLEGVERSNNTPINIATQNQVMIQRAEGKLQEIWRDLQEMKRELQEMRSQNETYFGIIGKRVTKVIHIILVCHVCHFLIKHG